MSSQKKEKMDAIVSLAKRRGFIYQGSDIYGGLAGTWDYGPLGVQLKKNITDAWWKFFVESRDDVYGIDAAILMNQKVWQASGHVDGFSDPLVEDLVNKKRHRADHLLEEAGLENVSSMTPDQMNQAFLDNNIKSPDGNPLSSVRQFNMMFKTHIGAIEDETSVSYLRPETAQGMFVNFKNVVDSFSPDMPFALAQIGKAFRNEISPRDFSIFRHKGNSARRICKGTFHSPGKKSPVLASLVRYFLPFALDKYSVLRWQVFRKKEKNVALWWGVRFVILLPLY
jgi:glycyl-tRNA synthetase